MHPNELFESLAVEKYIKNYIFAFILQGQDDPLENGAGNY